MAREILEKIKLSNIERPSSPKPRLYFRWRKFERRELQDQKVYNSSVGRKSNKPSVGSFPKRVSFIWTRSTDAKR